MEEISLKEFKEKLQRTPSSKKRLVTNSWGIRDAHKWIRKHGWYNIGKSISESDFYHIVRRVNRLLADNIAQGIPVVLPSHMGKLELRKREAGVSLINGVLKNTYPIDWNETLKLWYEDKESYEKKLLVRDEQPYIYYVKYAKSVAKYENKAFYQFVLNAFIKRALKENIKEGKIDTIYGKGNTIY